MRLPRFALKAPAGAFIPNTARCARGVSLHAGPSAPEAKGGRPPAVVGDSPAGCGNSASVSVSRPQWGLSPWY